MSSVQARKRRLRHIRLIMLAALIMLTAGQLYVSLYRPVTTRVCDDRFRQQGLAVTYAARASSTDDGRVLLTEQYRIKGAAPYYKNFGIAQIDNGSLAPQAITEYGAFTEPCDKSRSQTCSGVEATLWREITAKQGLFLSRAEIALTPLTVTYTQPGFDRWTNNRPFTWDFSRRTSHKLKLEGQELRSSHIEIRLPLHSFVSVSLGGRLTEEGQSEVFWSGRIQEPENIITGYYLTCCRFKPVQAALLACAYLGDIEWSRYFILWWGGLGVLGVLSYAYHDKK